MFHQHQHDYYVLTQTNEVVKMVLIFGVVFFIFGEIMYEKGKQAGKNQK